MKHCSNILVHKSVLAVRFSSLYNNITASTPEVGIKIELHCRMAPLLQFAVSDGHSLTV